MAVNLNFHRNQLTKKMAAEAEGLPLPEGTDDPRVLSAGPGTLDIELVISKLLAFKDNPEKQVRLELLLVLACS